MPPRQGASVSHSSREPRRRGWNSLKVLLLVGALAVGGGAFVLYPKWRSGPAAHGSADLTVRYRTDAPATGAAAKPWLEVINNSKKTVALSDVALRYYFSADDASAYGSNCVQTALGCSNITAKIGMLTGSGPASSHYLQIGFTAAAGSLEPGKTSQGIGLQLFRLDHKELDQSNDLSFDAKSTHYAPTKRVAAYLGGKHVWGDEPSGSDAAAGQGPLSVTAPAAAAPPAGVMFDDFSYTGPDDPALASNGWQVRTGQGGPGIKDTWSTAGISFPAEGTTKAGQSLQLQVTSDGTAKGTQQSELQTTKPYFFTGTLAARVYFSDKPTSGRNGDHINESFFVISPDHMSAQYSELDYEYMPNGGWGAPGPRLDTTSWRNSTKNDRVTKAQKEKLEGWHVLMITAVNGSVTYSMDGRELFTSDSKYFPRERTNIHFSAWLVDLPFQGPRTWDMRVDWLYYQAEKAVPTAEVEKAVKGFSTNGTAYVNTVPLPAS
ncbi:cellulose binding domain-containing protein [Streptomyces nojiriensis]|uniref:cellulose binding domain-containing protein n=1 Tax=Streptomyces nojiriensis TaxID=66374 RepID=UPI0036476A40